MKNSIAAVIVVAFSVMSLNLSWGQDQRRIYLVDAEERTGSIDLKIGRDGARSLYQRPTGRIYSAVFQDNGLAYFVNANDSRIFRVHNRQESVVYQHDTYVRHVRFGPDGALYFSQSSGAGADGVIYRLPFDDAFPSWEPESAEVWRRVPLGSVDGYWAGTFSFSPDGRLFLSSGNRKPAALYEFNSDSSAVQRFEFPEPITGFVFVDRNTIYFSNHQSRIYELQNFSEPTVIYERSEIGWLNDIALEPMFEDTACTITSRVFPRNPSEGTIAIAMGPNFYWHEMDGFQAEVNPDGGQFRFEGLPRGDYWISIYPPSGTDISYTPIDRFAPCRSGRPLRILEDFVGE